MRRTSRHVCSTRFLCSLLAAALLFSPKVARADYWNLLNTGTVAGFYQFATLGDMMRNVNPTAIIQTPGPFATDIKGTGADGQTYWNLFNTGQVAGFYTYANRLDMMLNRNPTAIVQTPGLFATYIQGTGSDGHTYWNQFNTGQVAGYYTYATLDDMMLNRNPTSIVQTPGLFATDIVGSGSDGRTYWNLFNTGQVAGFYTYATLGDMMLNVNPTSIVQTPGPFATTIIGTDADILPSMVTVPEPGTLGLMGIALLAMALLGRRARPA